MNEDDYCVGPVPTDELVITIQLTDAVKDEVVALESYIENYIIDSINAGYPIAGWTCVVRKR